MITGRQVRSARALLNWKQDMLAEKALVALTARLEDSVLGEEVDRPGSEALIDVAVKVDKQLLAGRAGRVQLLNRRSRRARHSTRGRNSRRAAGHDSPVIVCIASFNVFTGSAGALWDRKAT